jgi:hypothetical protein
MDYAFEASPEELEPQPSGNRSGGPPRHGTTVDLIDGRDDSLSRQSLPIPFKRISAVIGLALLLLAVGLLLVNIVWPR